MIIFLLVLNLVFSVLNFAMLIPLIKIAGDVVEALKESSEEEPLEIVGNKSLVDIKPSRVLDYDGTLPTHID